MSNKRKLSPQQTARLDQATAQARHAAQNPHTAVVVTDYAPDDVQCCWCDCPLPDHTAGGPDYRCDGCPDDAGFILRCMAYTPDERAYPLCERHYSDCAGFFRDKVFADVPMDVIAWEET